MDGLTQNPSILDLVIDGLANGTLWTLAAEAEPVWVGHGTLKPCVVCRVKINASEVQYDVPGPRGALPTHFTCYKVWRKQSDLRRRKTSP